MKIQMIVARYNESIDWIHDDWIHDYQIPTIIYNKGTKLANEFKINNIIIDLPNIGREGHTYLHHIITNYDNLADITVFFPGSLNKLQNKYGNTYKYEKARCVMKHAIQGKGVIMGCNINNLPLKLYNFTLTNWECTDKSNLKGSCSKTELATIRPFKKWYNHFFKNKPCNYFVTGSIFAIDKKNILQHPLIYYIKLILELQSHNPEAGHFLERSWAAVFEPFTNNIFIPYKY